MSTQRQGGADEERYDDLDAMVMAEIESLGRRRRAPTGQEEAWREPEVRPMPERTQVSAPPQYFGEEAEVLHQAPDETSEEDASPEDDIFSPEERAFLTRAVGFLRGRPNADAILGQVWEEVTSGDPQAYFSPEDDVQGDTDRDEAPGTDTE